MKLVIEKTASKDTVFIENVSPNTKLYFFKVDTNIYKLHQVDNGYAFIRMNDSKCWSAGQYNTVEEAILSELKYGHKVYEFDNLREANNWINSVI